MYTQQNTYQYAQASSAYPRTTSRQPSPSKPQKTPEQTRLSQLLGEFLQLGCLSGGFRYFETYLRGREEVLIKVYDSSVVDKDAEWKAKNNVKITSLVVDPRTLSPRTQKLAASVEIDKQAEFTNSPQDSWLNHEGSLTNTIIFLVAGYARYSRPFVWVRSGKELMEPWQPKDVVDNPDVPVKLLTTSAWSEQVKSPEIVQLVATSSTNLIHLTDIVWELITIAHQAKQQPIPLNPFSVDFSFYDSLPLEESVIRSGAMVSFLKALWLRGTIQYPEAGDLTAYVDDVWNDLSKLHQKHLNNLDELLALQNVS